MVHLQRETNRNSDVCVLARSNGASTQKRNSDDRETNRNSDVCGHAHSNDLSMPLLPSHVASKLKVPLHTLCLAMGYSFFSSFNPFLSYTVPYLVQVKGLTNFQVTNKVFPMSSYATLICTLLAALVCEYASSKTVIITGAFASVIAKLGMRFGTNILSLQIVEIIGAWSTASFYVYESYLYYLVTENHFQTLTSATQAAGSTALFVSSELGQLLVLIGSPLNTILYISIASASTRCFLAFILPREQVAKDKGPHFLINFFSRDQGFWSTVKETWTDKRLQLLSLWWAFALAGLELTLNYGTNLFEAIDSASKYNGQVIATGTALTVISALSSVYLKRPVAKLGGFLYIGGSLIYGSLCLVFAYSRTLWLAYVLYCVMLVIEKLLICFMYAHCGSLVKNDRYALMFSFNFGLAQAVMVAVQAIIEIAKADIFAQYKIMGGYFFGVAFVFSILYGLYVWKVKTWEIVSLEDLEAPKLIKVDLQQSLLSEEVATTYVVSE